MSDEPGRSLSTSTSPDLSGCDHLTPEALLTWDSVRRLELHTDIGPGNVGPLLIQVNFREHEYRLNLLREAGFDV